MSRGASASPDLPAADLLWSLRDTGVRTQQMSTARLPSTIHPGSLDTIARPALNSTIHFQKGEQKLTCCARHVAPQGIVAVCGRGTGAGHRPSSMQQIKLFTGIDVDVAQAGTSSCLRPGLAGRADGGRRRFFFTGGMIIVIDLFWGTQEVGWRG